MRWGTLFSSSTTYTYGDSAHKHAVTAVGSDTYSYDANGNTLAPGAHLPRVQVPGSAGMTCRVEGGITYKQEYNYENLLSAVKKMNGTCTGGTVLETTSFLYDGDGNLVKKTKPDGSKTIYVGGIYEVDKTSGGAVTRTVTYYPVAGAMRINSTLYYILKDHLGSASVVTDSTGAIVGEQRYYPYGETRFTSGTIYTDKLFTGQREMAGLGIYHYGARFYSPRTGRFLSADTIVPGAANPQTYNRYSYVLGNPLKYTDPSGHYCVGDDEDCADEPGDGPAPSGNGVGNNGNGGGGGNPHDDDDIDPNPDCIGCPGTETEEDDPATDILNQIATGLQDLATVTDVVGAAAVSGITLSGCIDGGIVGGLGGALAGCFAGGIEGLIGYNALINPIESYLSLSSTLFTVGADYLDDGQLGEASQISVNATLMGSVMVDPFTDLIIDGYVSEYNHDFLNDFDTIIFGGPIIK